MLRLAVWQPGFFRQLHGLIADGTKQKVHNAYNCQFKVSKRPSKVCSHAKWIGASAKRWSRFRILQSLGEEIKEFNAIDPRWCHWTNASIWVNGERGKALRTSNNPNSSIVRDVWEASLGDDEKCATEFGKKMLLGKFSSSLSRRAPLSVSFPNRVSCDPGKSLYGSVISRNGSLSSV